jgi:hypothetical protein
MISGRFRFAGIYFYLAYPMHHHYYIGDEARKQEPLMAQLTTPAAKYLCAN